MNIDINNLRVSDNKLFLRSDSEWVSGFTEIEIPKGDPILRFKGGKMKVELWFKILNFFLWTQEKYKSESQVRLYYNKHTKEWGAYPYPQTPNGMTTNDSQDKEIRSKFPDPWQYLGTAHHHCTSAAFQSGTDEANERQQDGWHYTIGHLDKAFLDYHGRFSWGGSLFKASLLDYIEFPDWINNIPSQIKYHTAMDYLCCSAIAMSSEYSFDEEWKSSIKPKAVTSSYNTNTLFNTQWDSYNGYQNNDHYWRQKSREEIKQEQEDEQELELIDNILTSANLNEHLAEEAMAFNPDDEMNWSLKSEIIENKNLLIQACSEANLTLNDFENLWNKHGYGDFMQMT